MKALIKPHITEKSYRLADGSQGAPQYTFAVAHRVDKAMVKKLVESEYKVTVTQVTVQNLKGSPRRFKGIVGRVKDLRKMVVRLKKGDRIAAFDVDKADHAHKEQDKQ
jgi:large subunit ribosomal protein L23